MGISTDEQDLSVPSNEDTNKDNETDTEFAEELLSSKFSSDEG